MPTTRLWVPAALMTIFAGCAMEDSLLDEEGEVEEVVVTDEEAMGEAIDGQDVRTAVTDGKVALAYHTWIIEVVQGHTPSKWGDGNAPDLYVKRFCGGAYRNKTPTDWNTF